MTRSQIQDRPTRTHSALRNMTGVTELSLASVSVTRKPT
jgi:hypothetical protein